MKKLLFLLFLFSCQQQTTELAPSALTADHDSDGMSNYDEFANKTNPWISELYPLEITESRVSLQIPKLEHSLGHFTKDESYYRNGHLLAQSDKILKNESLTQIKLDPTLFLKTHFEYDLSKSKELRFFTTDTRFQTPFTLNFKVRFKMMNLKLNNIINIKTKLYLLDAKNTLLGVASLELAQKKSYILQNEISSEFFSKFEIPTNLRKLIRNARSRFLLVIDNFEYEHAEHRYQYDTHIRFMKKNNHHLFYLTNNSYRIYSINKNLSQYPEEIIKFVFPELIIQANQVLSLNQNEKTNLNWFLHTYDNIIELNSPLRDESVIFMREILN